MLSCRAGAYADAVEEYTLSVSLDPAAVPVYTNRAAAYLKLKEWQAAAADCDMALTLLEGETGERGVAVLLRNGVHQGVLRQGWPG